MQSITIKTLFWSKSLELIILINNKISCNFDSYLQFSIKLSYLFTIENKTLFSLSNLELRNILFTSL